MLKANTKKLIFILIPLTLLILLGCSGPEEKRAQALNEVVQLRAAGDNSAALATLDALANEFPNDTEILRKIGSTHEALGNTAEAAFYLSAAYNQAPDDVELLYQTYRAQENANQSQAAHELLQALVEAEPDAITDELWLRLGEFRAEAQQTQSALDAYLKGIDPESSTPSAETAVAIGTLFKQLDNLPQAERWFNIAANSDDPNALPALFGLLDIHLRNKNWTAAESVIAQLDKQFPGAVDASEWATYRGELERWRRAQATMQADRAKAAANATAGATAAEQVATGTAIDTTEVTTTDTAEATGGKAQIIADMEHAEAMANTPAVEAESSIIAFDPNIAIQPAEPELTFGVTYDQQNQDAAIDYSVGTSDLNDTIAPDVVIQADAPATEPSSAISATLPPRSLDHMLADAESATIEHDYKRAIQLYWQALGRANNRADIWNMLSRVYRFDGQTKNAETTALEATRLAPAEIDYTLDYLRVIQRTKKPEDFLAELQTAYDRFPRSPEIALSLARGYERIDGNNYAAIMLYERFIQLAPNHSLRPEAEAALSRLR
ncbi:MAG: tetratricopeptide (TPR) repeat protein [Lentimonas sp.]|jgi:tetratricopeptide (TPR) repeat protein